LVLLIHSTKNITHLFSLDKQFQLCFLQVGHNCPILFGPYGPGTRPSRPQSPYLLSFFRLDLTQPVQASIRPIQSKPWSLAQASDQVGHSGRHAWIIRYTCNSDKIIKIASGGRRMTYLVSCCWRRSWGRYEGMQKSSLLFLLFWFSFVSPLFLFFLWFLHEKLWSWRKKRLAKMASPFSLRKMCFFSSVFFFFFCWILVMTPDPHSLFVVFCSSLSSFGVFFVFLFFSSS